MKALITSLLASLCLFVSTIGLAGERGGPDVQSPKHGGAIYVVLKTGEIVQLRSPRSSPSGTKAQPGPSRTGKPNQSISQQPVKPELMETKPRLSISLQQFSPSQYAPEQK